jgi:hypothetical protein
MKQTKKLTHAMKDLLKEQGLNPLNWRYSVSTAEELTLVHKKTGTTMVVKV